MNEEIIQAAITEIEFRIMSLTQVSTTLKSLLPDGPRVDIPPLESAAPIASRRSPAVATAPKNGGRRKPAPVPVVKEKRKYQRRAVEAPTTPAADSTATGTPTTFGAAMKLEILRIAQPFTADALRTVVAANHATLMEGVGESALSGNLSYWTSKGRLEKTATGYRVLEREFFQTQQN